MKSNQLTSRKRLPSLLLISMMLTLLALLPSIGARALVVLTATLAPTTTLSQTTTPTPSPSLLNGLTFRDDSLVTNAPCAAPCWNGITPGETSWSDAVAILEADEKMEGLTFTDSIDNEATVAEWQGAEGEMCCQVMTLDRETVYIVFLRFAPDVISLGEVIGVHGEPTYLVGTPISDDEAIANLIYPELSTVLYVFVAGAEGEIGSSSEVVGALYMTPEDMDLLVQTSSLNTWEGYETYSFYEQGEFEVTPAITLTPSM